MATHLIKLTLLFIFFVSPSYFVYGQGNLSPVSEKATDTQRQIEKNQLLPNKKAHKSQTTTSAKKDGGFVVSAYLGAAKTASIDLRISQPTLNTDLTFENVRLRSRSFESPQYYGLRAGYFFRQVPYIGVEAEFIHLKVYSDPQQTVRVAGVRRGASINREIALGEIVQQYSISHGANFLLFNLAARRGFWRGNNSKRNRLLLTAHAGIGPTIPHTESIVEGQRQEQYELGRLGWQIAAGTEIRFCRGIYALGEYKYTQARQNGKVAVGNAESFLRTHHGIFGLSYHF